MSNVRRQAGEDVSAQAEGAKSRFLSLFVLVKLSEDGVMPTCIGEGDLHSV